MGHVEWIEFGRVDRVPLPGGIAHATEAWEEPGGGGAVAAMRLAALAGGCEFFTAVGDDERGERMVRGLRAMGVEVHAAVRRAPTRRAVTLIDANGERTITTLGERLEPAASDEIPWDHLAGTDAVYVTAGDPGRSRRPGGRARSSSPRACSPSSSRPTSCPTRSWEVLAIRPRRSASRRCRGRCRCSSARRAPTEGRSGRPTGGRSLRAVPPSGPIVDTYGAGDSFAAGLTYALGAGRPAADAVGFAAACGARAVVVRGAGTGGP